MGHLEAMPAPLKKLQSEDAPFLSPKVVVIVLDPAPRSLWPGRSDARSLVWAWYFDNVASLPLKLMLLYLLAASAMQTPVWSVLVNISKAFHGTLSRNTLKLTTYLESRSL